MKTTITTSIRRSVGCAALLFAGTNSAIFAQSNTNTAETNAALNLVLQVNGSGTVTPNIASKVFVLGQNYTLTATPAAGWLFSNWVSGGTVVSTTPRYLFAAAQNVALQANFAVNPFPAVAGNYRGLFYVASNAAAESSGAFSASVNNKGAFTAQLRTAAKSFPFSGQFSLTGAAGRLFPRPGLPPLSAQFQLDWSNSLITGTVSDGTWTADLMANLAPYSSTNPAPQAGKYTVLIPGGNGPTQPAGNGFGSVVIAPSGAVTFTGFLGDGTAANCSSLISASGVWPFYVPLYGGQGSILGWFGFDTNNNISAQTGWFKLPVAGAKYYPGGFTNNAQAIGSSYHFTNGSPVLDFTQAQITLTNGDLAEGITNLIVMTPGAAPTALGGKLTFKTAAGMFTYTTANPETGKTIAVSGIVLQNQNLGGGYFLGTSQSGSAVLTETGIGSNVAQGSGTNLSSNSISSADLPDDGIFGLVTNLGPFAIYDQQEYPNAANVRLGYWPFASPDMTNNAGLPPTYTKEVGWTGCTFGHAALFTNAGPWGEITYPVFAGGTNYFNPTNGTVRFWYQPSWTSGTPGEPTNIYGQSFMSAIGNSGSWDLAVLPIMTNNSPIPIGHAITFAIARGNTCLQQYTFQTGTSYGAVVHFQSNLWYQMVLAYTPSNVALYTNGSLVATASLAPVDSNNCPLFDDGNGVFDYCSLSGMTNGFTFGNETGQACCVPGNLTALETFNYPLSPEQVAAGFPSFPNISPEAAMSDSNYTGRSDLLQQYIDGNSTNTQCRLGYWRFDAPEMYSEQGQMPFSSNDVSLVPGICGTAVNIARTANSELAYRDVFTNGWANFNCRQGTLRFWFKPNNVNGPHEHAPFVYMGSPDGMDMWDLSWDPVGSTISFTTGSNWLRTSHLTANCNFSSSTWTQIVLTYGPNATQLYLNGTLAASGAGVQYWPRLSYRNLGMVIGNTTACDNSINGQFDEMETFNYQLDASNILYNFQLVQAVDSDLDGTPDIIEDSVLPASTPFLGSPVVITGTVEAEQFDRGGRGVAYYNMASNAPSSYRPTGMFITNCDDFGGGFCLDETRAGEWVQYTINVLVPQVYNIETRVAGIETNGSFECEFFNGDFYTNTGPITITTANWTNLSAPVYLPAGTNVMRLHCLANGTDGAHVGRFNYISIHPWWQIGFASTYTNVIASASLSTNDDFTDATNNAAVIQQAINAMPPSGGTVLLPPGAFYVSPAHPNEANNVGPNAALLVNSNNIEIAGAGKTNTTLIAYNRATTVLFVGYYTNGFPLPVSNFILRDVTLQAQPHLAVVNVTNTTFEQGELLPVGFNATGALAVFQGQNAAHCSQNLLVTNCRFQFADYCIILSSCLSNYMVTHCDFDIWGGSNVYTGTVNQAPTNTPNTVGYRGSVGIFGDGSPVYNVSIVENTYNGNTNLVPNPNNPNGYVNTNFYQYVAPDGFVYFQSGGNFFIARNIISNNALEAVQLNAGPNSVVANQFGTLANDPSCCALSDFNGGWQGLTGFDPANYSTCFIGNEVVGDRFGVRAYGHPVILPFILNISGNTLNLDPPLAQFGEYPGAIAGLEYCPSASVLGNTLISGGHGLLYSVGCSNVLVMANDFSGARYRSIGHGLYYSGTLATAQIFNNILGQGSTYDVQLPDHYGFGWFIAQNACVDTNGNSVSLSLDPPGSTAHVMP